MSIHSLIQEQNTACTEQLHVPHLHRVAEDGGAEKKYGPCLWKPLF